MKIAIIGCGNMGEGIAQRLSSEHQVFLFDRHPEKMEKLQKEGFGTACQKMEEALTPSEVVILAVKPQSFVEVAKGFQNPLSHQILISLLAGTTIATIRKHIPYRKIIRMMPNLALICGQGAIGLASDEPLSQNDHKLIHQICTSLGKVYELSESKIDAFTALAGSGPAFVFALIEAMVEAGIGMGFDAKNAESIVRQMIKGSVDLLEASGKHPAALKWQIASPAGTTMAGLKEMEEYSVRAGIINTFFAAYERAKELS